MEWIHLAHDRAQWKLLTERIDEPSGSVRISCPFERLSACLEGLCHVG
jgi:hypothetical protein